MHSSPGSRCGVQHSFQFSVLSFQQKDARFGAAGFRGDRRPRWGQPGDTAGVLLIGDPAGVRRETPAGVLSIGDPTGVRREIPADRFFLPARDHFEFEVAVGHLDLEARHPRHTNVCDQTGGLGPLVRLKEFQGGNCKINEVKPRARG